MNPKIPKGAPVISFGCTQESEYKWRPIICLSLEGKKDNWMTFTLDGHSCVSKEKGIKFAKALSVCFKEIYGSDHINEYEEEVEYEF